MITEGINEIIITKKKSLISNESSLVKDAYIFKPIRINNIPPTTLPFDPKPTPLPNIKPIGARPLILQNKQERYLHNILNFIVSRNPNLFTGKLSKKNFRFIHDSNCEKTALVDKSNLSITVSDNFFDLIKNDAQAAAVICHELSHILRGHPYFISPPKIVLDNPKYKKGKLLLDTTIKMANLDKASIVLGTFEKNLNSLICKYKIKFPDKFNFILEKLKTSKGIEYNNIRTQLINKIVKISKSDTSIESKDFLASYLKQQKYNYDIEKINKINLKLNQIADEIMGEKNASKNWVEQEADELGLRIFVKSGFHPYDFINTLVDTLGKNQNLEKYWHDIKNRKIHLNLNFLQEVKKIIHLQNGELLILP